MEAIALLAFVFLLAWWFTRGKKEKVHTDTREVPTTADVITRNAGSSHRISLLFRESVIVETNSANSMEGCSVKACASRF